MESVEEHYAQHLAPVYAWMVGGIESALSRGAAEIADLAADCPAGAPVVDLGAGFGMHALPLARQGFEVLAIDSSALLLDELRSQRGDLPITAVQDDLQSYRAHLSGRPGLVLCMGDTIAHLPDRDAVENLIASVAADLAAGGRLVVTLRDYTIALAGEKRFIPVRSDAARIHVCFLEYEESRVIVHDLLHEWNGREWSQSVSAYPKLRLAPDWLAETMRACGLEVERSPGASGMVRLVARR